MSKLETPSRSSKQMLAVLNFLAMQGKLRLYQGTVPAKVVARRRARNKRARISRRINRG